VVDVGALQIALGALAGRLDRQERETIAYPIEENWLLRRQLVDPLPALALSLCAAAARMSKPRGTEPSKIADLPEWVR